MQFRNNKRGSLTLKKVETFERVVVGVGNGRRKSIKRSLEEYGRVKIEKPGPSKMFMYFLLATKIQNGRRHHLKKN